MNKPRLIMLCGVPGSGKSTWYGKYCESHTEHTLASTDFLIELAARLAGKTYNDVFQNTIKDATKTMFELVMVAVKDNMDIVWDQTNLNRKSRGQKLIMIPDHYEKIAIYFPIPDDLDKRLSNRPGKSIPYHVMKNMIDTFEIPQYDEGFDRIYAAKDVDDAKFYNVQVA